MQKKLSYYELETQLMHERMIAEDAEKDLRNQLKQLEAERDEAVRSKDENTEYVKGVLARLKATWEKMKADKQALVESHKAAKEEIERTHQNELEAVRQHAKSDAASAIEKAEAVRKVAEEQLAITESRAVVWAPWEIHSRDWYGVGNAVLLSLLCCIVLWAVWKQIRKSISLRKEHVGFALATPMMVTIGLLVGSGLLFWYRSWLDVAYTAFGAGAAVLAYFLLTDRLEAKAKRELAEVEERYERWRTETLDKVNQQLEGAGARFQKAVDDEAAGWKRKLESAESLIKSLAQEKASLLERMKTMKQLSPEQLQAHEILRRHDERVAEIKLLPLPYEEIEMVVKEAEQKLQDEIGRLYKMHGYEDDNHGEEPLAHMRSNGDGKVNPH